MSHRIFNFSAGPAMLPTEVLEKSAQALVDYQGKGFGIAEVRWPKQNGRAAGDRFDQSLRRIEFKIGNSSWNFTEIRVGKSVITDLVAFVNYPP